MESLFFLHLLALLVVVVLASGASRSKTKFMECSPTPLVCKDAINDPALSISYPFRKEGMAEYCGHGHPQFQVSCISYNSQNVPVLAISGKEYLVQNINYDTRFLAVSELAYSYSDSCSDPHLFTNTTIDSRFFNYSKNDINLTMYFNCIPMASSTLKNISCLETAGNHSYYRLPDHDNSSAPPPQEMCSSIVVIPMYADNAIPFLKGRVDFLGVLQNGFGLNWMAGGEWCAGCAHSGGVCGHDSSSPDAQTCFCPDGRTANGTCNIRDAKSRKAIAIGASLGAAALIAVCCALLCWCKRKKRLQQLGLSKLLSWSTCSKLSSKEDTELGESNYHTHIFSYDELQEATNGFDVSRELGDGGFGTVYKGKLRDGRTVAVKRLYENNYRRLQQFMNEVDILSRLRHQHLVTLYGCTSRHSRELLLVYEYIPNGTVADHLHGPHASAGTLPWHSRISIAIETADALAYLHAVEPQIIHRDVKSNNILLDNNFHVKVADFGLSRLFPLDATHVSTAPQGTPGYVDPEYHQCYQLTDKSDVYSFGVVLVELISSKPAVDISRTRHEINLANMAVSKIQKCELDQLVDPLLGYHSDLEVKRMITQVAELAFTCLQSDGDLRPSIKEVLEILRGIESGSYKAEKGYCCEDADAAELDTQLLKKNVSVPFSPDTVTERWQSRSTTPSNSNNNNNNNSNSG
ncbi:LEAF RUST 10 DISEASE-RESISTANCE LOCUS RECEPTOR-LIKE PROTEIN KINASE-like 1.2 isoform X1 [Iris pallida]|uniref:non-specific serine/threonine protein kinase n=1 Tax=Iris pallida TaxID=29817 RepID=A0AAX6DVZ7_IRIPA|nr:LEAF RUST 10 DISEASE-RESISTANCE LOCUS RECEPTOR-LIKE PROTEIN KINASE-like 1.2 isoform X1 [Iris pallida]